MDYLISLVPLAIGIYTFSFVAWLWKQNNKRGAIGTFLLTTVTIAVSIYAIYFREAF